MGADGAMRTSMDAPQIFGPFEVHLFVGIAASRKADILIGSVAAAQKVYCPCGTAIRRFSGSSPIPM